MGLFSNVLLAIARAHSSIYDKMAHQYTVHKHDCANANSIPTIKQTIVLSNKCHTLPDSKCQQTNTISLDIKCQQTDTISLDIKCQQTDTISLDIKCHQTNTISLDIKYHQTNTISLDIKCQQTDTIPLDIKCHHQTNILLSPDIK